MATNTKYKNLLYTEGVNIDANYGPWNSLDAYETWHNNYTNIISDGVNIGIKDASTGLITEYIRQNGEWKALPSAEDKVKLDKLEIDDNGILHITIGNKVYNFAPTSESTQYKLVYTVSGFSASDGDSLLITTSDGTILSEGETGNLVESGDVITISAVTDTENKEIIATLNGAALDVSSAVTMHMNEDSTMTFSFQKIEKPFNITIKLVNYDPQEAGDDCVVTIDDGREYDASNYLSTGVISFSATSDTLITLEAIPGYAKSVTVSNMDEDIDLDNNWYSKFSEDTTVTVTFNSEPTSHFKYTTENQQTGESVYIERKDGISLNADTDYYLSTGDTVIITAYTNTNRQVVVTYNEDRIWDLESSNEIPMSNGEVILNFNFIDKETPAPEATKYTFQYTTDGFSVSANDDVEVTASGSILNSNQEYEFESGEVITWNATTSGSGRQVTAIATIDTEEIDMSASTSITLTADTRVTFKYEDVEEPTPGPIVPPSYSFEYNVIGFENSKGDVISVTNLTKGDLQTGNTYNLTSGDVVTFSVSTSNDREFTCKVGDNDLTFDATGVATITMTANTTVVVTFSDVKDDDKPNTVTINVSGLSLTDGDSCVVVVNSTNTYSADTENDVITFKVGSSDTYTITPTAISPRTVEYSDGEASYTSAWPFTGDTSKTFNVVFSTPDTFTFKYSVSGYSEESGDTYAVTVNDSPLAVDETHTLPMYTKVDISGSTSETREVVASLRQGLGAPSSVNITSAYELSMENDYTLNITFQDKNQ